VDLLKSNADPNLPNLLNVTGALRFPIDRARPDLLLALGEISTGSTPHPSKEHVDAAKQLVRYIKSTSKTFMKFGYSKGKQRLFGFSDASGPKLGDAKGRLGGCLFYGFHSGAFYSYSSKATTVAHSVMENEIMSMDRLIRDVTYFKEVLQFLGEETDENITIFVDAKNAIDLFSTLKSNKTTRHLNVRISSIREQIECGNITFRFVPSELNVADILTKPLSHLLFREHSDRLLHGFEGDISHLFEYAGRRQKIELPSTSTTTAIGK
jgi:hypothetical protein